MGQLYDQVAALDRGVADRWKLRTRENINYTFRAADVDYIFGPVFQIVARQKTKFTERQGAAIVLLAKNANFAPDGVKRFKVLLEKADSDDRWKMVPLITDQDLADVYRALNNDVTGRIIFKSPGTHLAYSPTDYDTISRLISRRDIPVFEARAGLLSGATKMAAYYDISANTLNLHEFTNPAIKTGFIVHESTHAIQDWKNVRSLRHHEEADAFIAQYVVLRVLQRGGPTDDDGEDPKIVDNAAVLVLAGKAGEGDAAWKGAYDAVVGVVAKFYPDLKGKWSANGPKGERINEPAIYKMMYSRAVMMQTAMDDIVRSSQQLQKALANIDFKRP